MARAELKHCKKHNCIYALTCIHCYKEEMKQLGTKIKRPKRDEKTEIFCIIYKFFLKYNRDKIGKLNYIIIDAMGKQGLREIKRKVFVSEK